MVPTISTKPEGINYMVPTMSAKPEAMTYMVPTISAKPGGMSYMVPTISAKPEGMKAHCSRGSAEGAELLGRAAVPHRIGCGMAGPCQTPRGEEAPRPLDRSWMNVDQATHNKTVSFIWNIADDVLRDLFVRGTYRESSRCACFGASTPCSSRPRPRCSRRRR